MQRNYLCSTKQQVEELGVHWDKLQTYLDAPVAKFDWILSCVENLLEKSSLYIPVASDGTQPVAIAPLVKPNGFFGAVQQIGVSRHGEPADFLYKDAASLDLLTHVLSSGRIPLLLMRIPEESPVIQALEKAYKGKAFINLRPQVGCPFIEVQANEEQVLNSLPSRLRSDLRRAQRKAETLGEITFEMHAPASLAELTPVWNESLRVEAAGWKGRSHTALAEDQNMASFFLSYADRACQQGILRIYFMRIGGQVVAMQIAIEASDRLWLLKIGYDEDYAKCSPGMLLMLETLQYAARKGLASYEFLGAAKDWTRRWTKTERNNVTIRIYPYTIKGLSIFIHDTSTYFWKRMVGKFRKVA
jgi:CelD/BcsL family acetyltransferase involved in cellulose biosynthesis